MARLMKPHSNLSAANQRARNRDCLETKLGLAWAKHQVRNLKKKNSEKVYTLPLIANGSRAKDDNMPKT